jgi:hypothetical protein
LARPAATGRDEAGTVTVRRVVEWRSGAMTSPVPIRSASGPVRSTERPHLKWVRTRRRELIGTNNSSGRSWPTASRKTAERPGSGLDGMGFLLEHGH